MAQYPYSTARLVRPNMNQQQSNDSRMGAIQRRLQQMNKGQRKRPGAGNRPY